MKWTYALHYAFSSLCQLFYPRFCASCGAGFQGEEEVLCLHCLMALPYTGHYQAGDNAALQIFTGRISVERASSFLYFTRNGIVQNLLHQLKYKDRQDIGLFLGRLLGEELAKQDWFYDIDGIIAIPLHRKKRNTRGYNQADCVARGLSEASGVPVLKGILVRKRNTRSQTRKTRLERMENMEDVFLLKCKTAYKHILLVDDVLTTGATLEAGAKALLQNAGTRVSIATLALASS